MCVRRRRRWRRTKGTTIPLRPNGPRGKKGVEMVHERTGPVTRGNTCEVHRSLYVRYIRTHHYFLLLSSHQQYSFRCNNKSKNITQIYCRSGNFCLLKFSRISDFGIFHEVWNSQIFIFLWWRYYNNNFREILEFANLSSSRKFISREYYQIYSIALSYGNVYYNQTVCWNMSMECNR